MAKYPKYLQIIEHYINEIKIGSLKNGEQIPNEIDLCTVFDTSRMTINKAMTELSVKGYIKRIPGKGSFVSNEYEQKISKPFLKTSDSFTNDIILAGLTPRTELIDYRILKGKDLPEAAAALQIDADGYIHFFVRKRFGNDKLLALSYSYINYDILPVIDIKALDGSLNDYINKLGINRSHGFTEISACLPDDYQAKIIGTAHIALLKQTIGWNVNDVPFEITHHYYIGEAYSIKQGVVMVYDKDGSHHKELLTSSNINQ
ncbi:HTH-type transcriptional repressor YvoA [bioreactor metagenome]|uniref:HTH-type transcriptional repressor YvoA n=1 Tax=bioreactor metagenome TaxID=1076179 RepID=A0A644YQG8_9ZZZZ